MSKRKTIEGIATHTKGSQSYKLGKVQGLWGSKAGPPPRHHQLPRQVVAALRLGLQPAHRLLQAADLLPPRHVRPLQSLELSDCGTGDLCGVLAPACLSSY
jgi:hypothetical protein